MLRRKIKLLTDESISYKHRDGWNYARIQLAMLHNPYGIDFFEWLDKTFSKGIFLNRPWSGFLHSPIKFPQEKYQVKYDKGIMSLEKLVQSKNFNKSLAQCRGVFTLSKINCDFLQSKNVPCCHVKHPVRLEGQQFKGSLADCEVYTMGQMMRMHHDFLALQTKRKKNLIKVPGHDAEYDEMFKIQKNYGSFKIHKRFNNSNYDLVLEKNIIFLSLYDCAACNTVLECISKSTPLVVNRLPALEEYLGESYPGFYQDLHEASRIIDDDDAILKIHEYLNAINKFDLSPRVFLDVITSSEIYNNFSLPPSL